MHVVVTLGTIESMYPLYPCLHCLKVSPQYLWSQIIGMWTVIFLLNGVVCVMTVLSGGGGSSILSVLTSPRACPNIRAFGGGSLRSDIHSSYLT